MKGRLGPIGPCPLCLQKEDTLEHLITCTSTNLRLPREHFQHLLLQDIRTYCITNRLQLLTMKYSIAYAHACANPDIGVDDAIGGWLGIPTPRFLFCYQPNSLIPTKVERELHQVLPRIIAESIKWLYHA